MIEAIESGLQDSLKEAFTNNSFFCPNPEEQEEKKPFERFEKQIIESTENLISALEEESELSFEL